jgi:hypothetical protein
LASGMPQKGLIKENMILLKFFNNLGNPKFIITIFDNFLEIRIFIEINSVIKFKFTFCLNPSNNFPEDKNGISV